MRFLQFVTGEFEGKKELEGQQTKSLGDFMREKFSLGEDAREAILYALAYCSSASDPTLPALVRLRQYLRSAGRYGNSPFLVGHYGGLGELAQGFCRTCAVKGGTYILGRKILSLNLPSAMDDYASSEAARASIQLEDVPDILTADFVIASSDYLPSSSPGDSQNEIDYACCIAITDRPLSSSLPPPSAGEVASFEPSYNASSDQPEPDTAVVVFPPGSLPEGNAPNAVRVLQMGEATLSCPRQKYILYLWTRTDELAATPEGTLGPYLSAVTSSFSGDGSKTSYVDFSLFYMRHEIDKPAVAQSPRTFVVPQLPSDWPEIADRAAQDAETLFWDVVKELGEGKDGELEALWPPLEEILDEDEGEGW